MDFASKRHSFISLTTAAQASATLWCTNEASQLKMTPEWCRWDLGTRGRNRPQKMSREPGVSKWIFWGTAFVAGNGRWIDRKLLVFVIMHQKHFCHNYEGHKNDYMKMGRIVSHRIRRTEELRQTQEHALNSTIFILKEFGPTSFLLQDESGKKYRVSYLHDCYLRKATLPCLELLN